MSKEKGDSNCETKINPEGYYKWYLARKESLEAGSMSGGKKNSIRYITARAGWQIMSLATRELGTSVIATFVRPCDSTTL